MELVEVEDNLASSDAILKACYWLSRDFVCDIRTGNGKTIVAVTPKDGGSRSIDGVGAELLASMADFSLRERISAKTDGVRDLILAKAFSEAGVLEDVPSGVFGDVIEESKPDGLFKILTNY